LINDCWTRLTIREQGVATLTARYEALRDHAIERHPDGVRHGSALVLRQGVAAWMQVTCETATTATPDTAPLPAGARLCSLPEGAAAQMVYVLAAMALKHAEEVHV
jgi:hypothetical protein